ncbi:hypothetical protein BaRGS_00005256, partial [Batillaria attramentaria]
FPKLALRSEKRTFMSDPLSKPLAIQMVNGCSLEWCDWPRQTGQSGDVHILPATISGIDSFMISPIIVWPFALQAGSLDRRSPPGLTGSPQNPRYINQRLDRRPRPGSQAALNITYINQRLDRRSPPGLTGSSQNPRYTNQSRQGNATPQRSAPKERSAAVPPKCTSVVRDVAHAFTFGEDFKMWIASTP